MTRYVSGMLNDYVISGLTKRRAILLGEIMQIERQLNQKLVDLRTLDAAIKLFDADYPIEIIKPKKLYRCSDWATRGEMTRLILNILRLSPKPLSAKNIALQIMAHKQIDTGHPERVTTMRRRVGEALRKQQLRGRVRYQKQPGQHQTWEIVTPPPAASSLSTAC